MVLVLNGNSGISAHKIGNVICLRHLIQAAVTFFDHVFYFTCAQHFLVTILYKYHGSSGNQGGRFLLVVNVRVKKLLKALH